MSRHARRVCYLSGTRADFGLMRSTLMAIAADENLSLEVIVTGTHLSERFGMTVSEIEAAALPIRARIAVDATTATGSSMALNLARTIEGVVKALESAPPQVVLLLGDRGEMLAGAIAALHLNIPMAHVHGGERSGTVDEPVRHAISKLAHFHFVATLESRERLVRMGEAPDRVHVTGAPGLDGLLDISRPDRADLCARVGFDPAAGLALMVYHPVLNEVQSAGAEARAIIEACLRQGLQVFALMPNSDSGHHAVSAALHAFAGHAKVRIATHLHRPEFIAWMAACDVMIGNSSSGIIEAASFGTPVCNVGTRQHLRERNANVVDVHRVADELDTALAGLLRRGRLAPGNVYGDGHAGCRIVEHLRSIDLSPAVLSKTNAY